MSRKPQKPLLLVDEVVMMTPLAQAAVDLLLKDPVGQLQAALDLITTPPEVGPVLKPTTFIRDGVLHVSAEDGGHFADYYGDFRGGSPWIDRRLEAAAHARGFFWEWVNPGCIAAYKL